MWPVAVEADLAVLACGRLAGFLDPGLECSVRSVEQPGDLGKREPEVSQSEDPVKPMELLTMLPSGGAALVLP